MNFVPILPGGGGGFGGFVIGLAALVVVIVCTVRWLKGKPLRWGASQGTGHNPARCRVCGADRSQLHAGEACASCGGRSRHE